METSFKAVADRQAVIKDAKLHILTDCQSALGVVTAASTPKNFTETIMYTHNRVNALSECSIDISITWIERHVSQQGNELADQQAKAGALATLASERQNHHKVTPEVTKLIKSAMV